jgi:hypothetical protein
MRSLEPLRHEALSDNGRSRAFPCDEGSLHRAPLLEGRADAVLGAAHLTAGTSPYASALELTVASEEVHRFTIKCTWRWLVCLQSQGACHDQVSAWHVGMDAEAWNEDSEPSRLEQLQDHYLD